MITSLLPDSLKLVDIKPIFKKVLRNGKGNYRPVSMRLNISKLYKTFSISRLTLRFYLLFSVSVECGFTKGFSAQNCSLSMTKKWRKCLDTGDIS